jgi:hypothetical protein
MDNKRHFILSLIKSVIRISAGVMFITYDVVLGGILLIIAEILGIGEEL